MHDIIRKIFGIQKYNFKIYFTLQVYIYFDSYFFLSEQISQR